MSKCGEAGKKSRREEGRVNGLHGTNLLLDGLLLPFEFSFLIVVTICFSKIDDKDVWGRKSSVRKFRGGKKIKMCSRIYTPGCISCPCTIITNKGD